MAINNPNPQALGCALGLRWFMDHKSLSTVVSVESPAYVTSIPPIQIYLQHGVRMCAIIYRGAQKCTEAA